MHNIVANKWAKFGAKIFRRFWDIAIFVLGYFILLYPVYVSMFQTSPAAVAAADITTTESPADHDDNVTPWWVIFLICIGCLLLVLLIILLILLLCWRRSVLYVLYVLKAGECCFCCVTLLLCSFCNDVYSFACSKITAKQIRSCHWICQLAAPTLRCKQGLLCLIPFVVWQAST